MDKGYIENGFIVDVSNANKTSEIIYELSNVLDLPDAQCKKVCLKLGSIDLSTSQLNSIKALVECMNSELEFISTSSDETKSSAEQLGVSVQKLENKVPTPEFNAEDDKINQELEKALDKIFGDGSTTPEMDSFSEAKDPAFRYESSSIDEIVFAIQETPEVEEETNNYNEFNQEIENANNNIAEEEEEDLTEDIKEHLKETEKLPTLYIQRTLRSGQSITSEGNIVIIGDVHPGSEIIAAGDITVWGVLGGIAHAGAEGNKYARIRALKMHAIQLRIAEVFARRPDNSNIPYVQKTDTFTPEEACVKNRQIIIQKIIES